MTNTGPPTENVRAPMPGGQFKVQLLFKPVNSGALNCRQTTCALLSKRDHGDFGDRSSDVFIPITVKGQTAARACSRLGSRPALCFTPG
ncbi:hypothetical protein [Kibdelosporangium phytohabitans]|nr:hypothetical protein [Kibdelosporangium phytohabitans]MBE1464600.1 hypothetical protein [Kibdelosporangium phytohabitans]